MSFLNIVIGVPIRLLFFVPGWLWGHVSAGFQMGVRVSRSYDDRLRSAGRGLQDDTRPNPNAH